LAAKAETATRSIVNLQAFRLLERNGGDGDTQWRFKSLLEAAAVHMDLHRLSAAHRLKLRAPVIGGPDDVGAATLGSNAGALCTFGVAPIVGVVVNHPFVHGPEGGPTGSAGVNPRGLASLSVVTLWGPGGSLHERLTMGRRLTDRQATRWFAAAAATLVVLHEKGLAIGRLDAHAMALYPRVAVGKGPRKGSRAGRSSNAKVVDLTRVCPVGESRWKLRELVRHPAYLSPCLEWDRRPHEPGDGQGGGQGDDGDDGDKRCHSQAIDLWYLGCLGLEIAAKCPLASLPFGSARGLTRDQIDDLIPPRLPPVRPSDPSPPPPPLSLTPETPGLRPFGSRSVTHARVQAVALTPPHTPPTGLRPLWAMAPNVARVARPRAMCRSSGPR
jgi:hypothetical protein